MKALNKDILRTIWKEKKRFISIMMITTLGVTVMTGLSAGCQDLRLSADLFFDAQDLFDVSVQSTLGLTDEDVEALQALDGVEKAEGSFSEVVHTKRGDVNKTAEVKMIREGGLNLPYLVDGALPQNADEIVVTKNYMEDTGRQIGDVIEIEELMDEEEEPADDDGAEAVEDTNDAEDDSNKAGDTIAETKPDTDDSSNAADTADTAETDTTEDSDDLDTDINTDVEVEIEEEVETPNFLNTTFTITGVVIDVMDINNADGSVGFRATPNADYTFFVTPEAIDSDVYTTVYLSLSGTEELLCYTGEYEEKTGAVIFVIEDEIMEQREQARYDEITGEAYGKVDDAEKEMNEKFLEAEEEFASAEEDLSEGWTELEDGRTELTDKETEAAQEIADGKKEIEDGYKELEEALAEIVEAEQELAAGEQQLAEGKMELAIQEEKAKKQLEEAQEQIDEKAEENKKTQQQLKAGLTEIQMLFGEEWTKEGGVGKEWDAYVDAAEVVLLPMIQNMMNGEQNKSEAELQQEIMAALGNNQAFLDAQNAFFEKVTTVSLPVIQSSLTNQKAALETMITTAQTELDALKDEKKSFTDKETEVQEAVAEAEEKLKALDPEDSANADAIAELKKKIEDGNNELEELKQEIAAKEQAIATKEQEIAVLTEQQTQLSASLAQVNAIVTPGDAQTQFFTNLTQLAIGTAQTNVTETVLEEAQETLDEQEENMLEQLAEAWEELAAAEAELVNARAEIAKGRQEIEDNRKKLDDGLVELSENEEKANKEFADARVELADAEQELLDGEEELEENRTLYEEKKADAIEKIEDARKEIADIDMTQWYVQDRTSLSGYVNVDTDAACIESLASVFSIVFFVVAILISLTTVTRMVEEERGLIGTYKALGFNDREIRKKYVAYALSASVFGGILGDIGGFVILPEILFIFFDVMYMLPAYYLQIEPVAGLFSVLLFIIGITGAAIAACRAELKHLPAHLMRPKSPKMGTRVFLEYITPLWKHFSFLNKVTARNLFRYKKRLIMTVVGIMGCTALLVFGFAIKDSVAELMPLQYENVYKYDLLAATAAEDNDKLLKYMENSSDVTTYLNIQVETVKLKNVDGASEKVQMLIFPDGASIEEYFTLTNTEASTVTLGEEGIYLTENAANILGLEKGGMAAVQRLNLEQKETVIADLVKNYLGNSIYMSEKAYEKMFGEYEPNGVLANLADTCTDQIAFSDTLSEEDWILSSVSTQDLKDGFSAAFTLINIVVYVVLILAAGLAFVVLFTLASVNISERIRELATIKVLGFFDREVHAYVNKETLILTGIGILLGLPLGAAMSGMLTSLLDMPSIYFAVTIYDKSYFFAGGLALLFALLVQLMTDRTLNAISPAEALKSVE